MADPDDLPPAVSRALSVRRQFRIQIAVFVASVPVLIAIWVVVTGMPSGFTAPFWPPWPLEGASIFTSSFWPLWPIGGMTAAAILLGLDAYGVTGRYLTRTQLDAELTKRGLSRDRGWRASRRADG